MVEHHLGGDVHQRIADLARSLHTGSGQVPDSGVDRIVDHAAGEIPGAQYASVTLVTGHSRVETPAATHPYAALLDGIQERHRL